MNNLIRVSLGFFLIATGIVGCSRQQATQTPAARTSSGASVDAARFLLSAEPEGAQDVIRVRESAKNEDDVVIVGRIGGSAVPWVEGRGAFSIVDPSLLACSDREGDNCTQPWDYCCDTDKLPTSTALIKFVDEDGMLVHADAREFLNVKELQTVVVRGKAQRDDAGNLTVFANGLYVRE